MRDELLQRAYEAVSVAKKAGAGDVWASASRSRDVEFSLRDGNLETVKDATSRGLSLKLFVDGRYSSSRTTDLRPEQIRSFVADAVALTRALQPDPFRTIPDAALFEGRADVDLELVDANVRSLSRDERIHLCEEQNGAIQGMDKLISATSGSSDGHTISAAVSSNGFEGTNEETYLWIGSTVTLQDAGDRKPEGWMWGGAANREDLPSPSEVASLAMKRARRQLGSTKGPTTKTTMVIDPSAAGQMVARLLASANGRSIQQGQSFWLGKRGQSLISEKLVVVDNPLLKRGLASRLYDAEGIAAREIPLLVDGALQNYYVDTYYAKKLMLSPTTGSASNRIVQPGLRGLDAIMSDCSHGIYVTDFLGGNADDTTGDFSFGVQGHLIEGGQLGQAVGEMNVTGNLLAMFNQLVEVGNDPWLYSSLLCPTLVFDDIQFSGV